METNEQFRRRALATALSLCPDTFTDKELLKKSDILPTFVLWVLLPRRNGMEASVAALKLCEEAYVQLIFYTPHVSKRLFICGNKRTIRRKYIENQTWNTYPSTWWEDNLYCNQSQEGYHFCIERFYYCKDKHQTSEGCNPMSDQAKPVVVFIPIPVFVNKYDEFAYTLYSCFCSLDADNQKHIIQASLDNNVAEKLATAAKDILLSFDDNYSFGEYDVSELVNTLKTALENFERTKTDMLP